MGFHFDLRGLARPLTTVHALVFAVLLIPVAAKVLWGVPPEDMTRDGVSVMDAPIYTGVVSTLGIVLWGSACALCLFAAAVVGRRAPLPRGFWIGSAAVTFVLLADDLLLIHEELAPHYVGIPETGVYVAYAACFGAYAFHFRRELLSTNVLPLAVSAAWIAVSLGLDYLEPVYTLPAHFLFEDGAKLFAIAVWLLYYARTARAAVIGAARPAAGSSDPAPAVAPLTVPRPAAARFSPPERA